MGRVVGPAGPAGPAGGLAVGVRQGRVDDVVAAARQKVKARKDSVEACAAKWIESRSGREGA